MWVIRMEIVISTASKDSYALSLSLSCSATVWCILDAARVGLHFFQIAVNSPPSAKSWEEISGVLVHPIKIE